jgi:excisionase family DNA binding protein
MSPSPTTIAISLPEEQLGLLRSVENLLSRHTEQANGAVWLTEAEAADRLKVSLSTIRKWRSEGWLRYFSEGERVIKYKATYLDADFEAHCLVKAANEPLIQSLLNRRKAS